MNYINLMKTLTKCFQDIGLIDSIHYSRLAVERGNIAYPAVIIVPQNIATDYQGINTMQVSILYIENYHSQDQILEIQSRGLDILKLVMNKLYDNYPYMSITQISNFQPFADDFSDKCSGMSSTFQMIFSDEIGQCTYNDCNYGS